MAASSPLLSSFRRRPAMADAPFEPGSFRDRTSRVFYQDGAVLRGLNAHAAREREGPHLKAFLPAVHGRGEACSDRTNCVCPVIFCSRRAVDACFKPRRQFPLSPIPTNGPFSMLQDAALLTLELQAARAPRRHDAQGRHALQYPVVRQPASLY